MRALLKNITALVILLPHYLGAQTVTYTSHNENIANPERGFYHHTEVHSGSYNNLNSETLINYRQSESITQILRVFYLEAFRNGPISRQYLDNIRKDMAAVRNAGLKAIIRFAYSTGTSSPYNDAKPAVVQTHINQLKPILRENADVIAVMQAGFVGTWGEWYYTDHFAESIGSITEENWQDRREVVYSLLDALTKDRMLQIRTPGYKMKIFNTEAAITSELAFENSYQSRLGHHNDCFVASSSDFGTYINQEVEKPYLEAETLYLPMGGETCALASPYSDCDNSVSELERFHWSYLNIDYNRDVLNEWDNQGCFDEITLKLGYRYELIDGTFSASAKPQGEFNFNLNLINTGYSNPYNPRDFKIVIRNQETNEEYFIEPVDDIRLWPLNESINITFSAGLPADITTGNYDLLLHMPDPYGTLQHPAYAIQMANTNVWEAETGYNKLNHVLEVTNDNELPDYSGNNYFITASGNNNTIELEGDSEIGGSTDHESVLLYWKKQSPDLTRVIEKSTDGNTFKTVAQIPGNQHFWKDLAPATEPSSYRYFLTDGTNSTITSSNYDASLTEETSIDISIDGEPNDWQTIPPIGTNFNQGLLSIRAYFDSENLFLNMIGGNSFKLYLNADNDISTGYSGDSTQLIGMDYQITASSVATYDNTWQLIDVATSTSTGEALEIAISFEALKEMEGNSSIPAYGIIDGKEITDSDNFIPLLYRRLPPDLPDTFEIANSTLSPKTKLVLSWSECQSCDGYRIERSIDGETFSELSEYSQSIQVATDENLDPDTEYFYRMQTFNSLGISPFSRVVTSKTKGVILKSETQVIAHPNPTTGAVLLHHRYQLVQIVDLSGKIVNQCADCDQIDISDSKQGIYYLKAYSEQQQVTEKIMKQ